MANFRVDVFRGTRPRVNPRLLPEGEAQTAQNTRLGSGSLEPWNDLLATGDTVPANTISIHRMDNNGVPFWLSSTNDVDYARGPVPNDELERTYYTGESQPRMTYIGIAPADYRYLGIPAPGTAPTLDGEDLPPEGITGTSTEGSFNSNYLHADFSINQGLPAGNVNYWGMALTEGGVPSDNGYEAEGTVRTYEFDFYVGKTMRVASVVDANTVELADANEAAYLAEAVDRDGNGKNWWRTDDGDTTRAGFFRFYLPNNIRVTLTAHTLEEGDVIRITAIPSTIAVTFTQPAGAEIFYGYESDNAQGTAATNTWAASPSAQAVDSFYSTGSGYPFEEIWIEDTGPASSASFDINGSFTWELIERDGESYESVATDIESRVYVYTFVSELGEEGPPSPPSDVVTIPTQGEVIVGGFEAPPTTQRNITNMRIYRANTGSDQTVFQFVAEIADPFADYTDNVSDLDLGEILQTESWEPPPTDLRGLIALPNGGMAGFTGKTVCLSEPYYPHAWPPEYQIAVDYDVIGLGIVPNGVAILTKGPVYIASGDHPRAMSTRHFNDSQACVSKRSIANTTDGVIYAAPDGLAFVGSSGFQLLTKDHTKKREWQLYDPSEFIGFWHDSLYIGFTNADPLVPGNITVQALVEFTELGGATTFQDNEVFGTQIESITQFTLLNGFNSIKFVDGEVLPTGWSIWVENSSYGYTLLNYPSNTAFEQYDSDPGDEEYVWHTPILSSLDDGQYVDVIFSEQEITTHRIEITVANLGSGVIGQSSGATLLRGDSATAPIGCTLEDIGSPVNVILYFTDATARAAFATDNAGRYIKIHRCLPGSTNASMVGIFGVDEMATSGNNLTYQIPTGQFPWTASDVGEKAWVEVFSSPTAPTDPAGRIHGIVFDPNETGIGLSTLSLTARVVAGHLVPEDDELYVLLEGETEIKQWDEGTSTLEATWKSGRIICDHPANLGAARVVAEEYPVTFNLYNDQGTLVTERTVTSSEVFRLPGGYLTDWFEIEIISSTEVSSVQVAETVGELLRG